MDNQTDGHYCPRCGRRMKSDFDEDVGLWYECENCDYREAVSSVAAPSPVSPSLIPEQESLITENPFEQIVERALLRAGYSYVTDHGGDSPARLDFYLPADDVHIEVKTMHSDRVAEQMSRAANVIVAQGRAAIEWLAARIVAAATPFTATAAELGDWVNAAAVAISEYLQAPPSTVGTIERLIARHCFPVGSEEQLHNEMERGAMIETIKELEKDRDELRRAARMALQQFEFTYGERKRGWDAKFLMKRLRTAVADSEGAGEFAATLVTATSAARECAAELERGNWLLSDITPEEREQVAAIISRYFPSAVPVEEQSYEFAFDQRCYYCRNKCCHDAKAHIAAISEHG